MIARCLLGFGLTLVLATGPALANEKVTLRLNWIYGSEFAPIFVARDKGFFGFAGHTDPVGFRNIKIKPLN